MAINLKKGSTISLSKECASLGINSLEKVAVGLGWDCNESNGVSFDLDAWALAITPEGIKNKNLVYFGNVFDSATCIHHCGDNLTGAGDGDDESINIDLVNALGLYDYILVGVTIYRAGQKRQSFKDVKNAFIRVYDRTTGIEICKYNDQFTSELGDYASMLFGAFVKVNGVWEFRAIGKGAKFSSIKDATKVYADYALLLSNEALSNKSNNTNNINNGGKKTMGVSLSKGGKVSLAKVASDAGIAGALTKITIGLGWDTQRYDGGAAFDLDASAFCCGENGKVPSDEDFVFYNNKVRPGIEHMGDNRTGDGDGDDEQINIDLSAVPANISEINFTVTINDADTNNQNFGMVENSFIRIIDQASGAELLRYDLGEDFSVETALVVAKLYRNGGEWKFNAIGSGFAGGLAALCGNFGVNVG